MPDSETSSEWLVLFFWSHHQIEKIIATSLCQILKEVQNDSSFFLIASPKLKKSLLPLYARFWNKFRMTRLFFWSHHHIEKIIATSLCQILKQVQNDSSFFWSHHHIEKIIAFSLCQILKQVQNDSSFFLITSLNRKNHCFLSVPDSEPCSECLSSFCNPHHLPPQCFNPRTQSVPSRSPVHFTLTSL